jgi:hypothetical protein
VSGSRHEWRSEVAQGTPVLSGGKWELAFPCRAE